MEDSWNILIQKVASKLSASYHLPREEALDCTHSAFARVYKKVTDEEVDLSSAAFSYLYVSAKNEFFGRVSDKFPTEEYTLHREFLEEDTYTRETDNPRLYRSIDSLKYKYRQLLWMLLQGADTKEIALEFDIGPRTARRWRREAMAELKTAYINDAGSAEKQSIIAELKGRKKLLYEEFRKGEIEFDEFVTTYERLDETIEKHTR